MEEFEIAAGAMLVLAEALAGLTRGNVLHADAQRSIFNVRRAILDAWEPYDDRRKELLEEFDPDEEMDQIQEQWGPLMQQTEEVEFSPIPWSDLTKGGGNVTFDENVQLLLDMGIVYFDDEDSEDD